MKKYLEQIRIKTTFSILIEFFIGFSIFLVPFLSFMKPSNAKQLATYDIFLFIASQLIILLTLLLISILLYFIITKIFKTQSHSIFLLLCVGYYLLFFFSPIYGLITSSFSTSKNALTFALVCIFLIWIVLSFGVYYFKSFSLFFRRAILIFASLNIIIFCIWHSGTYIGKFAFEILVEKKVAELSMKQNLFNFDDKKITKLTNKNEQKNIYYVILDGMMSLELAKKNFEIDVKKIKELFQTKGLKNIKNSFTNYSNTAWTLAAIMEIDFVPSRESMNEKYGGLFPHMMYQNKSSVPLPELINKFGNQFFWVGNYIMPCLSPTNQPWFCIHSNKERNLRYLGDTLYFDTPLKLFLTLLYGPDAGQRNVKFYMEYLKKNNKLNNKKFVFIHQLSPHTPFTVNEDCTPNNNNNRMKLDVLDKAIFNIPTDQTLHMDGYRDSYLCNIKEVLEFTKFISIKDPNAIVIFQGDHGWPTPSPSVFDITDIFNVIKAPEICFEKFEQPRSNVNTIRFALNCGYGLELPYLNEERNLLCCHF